MMTCAGVKYFYVDNSWYSMLFFIGCMLEEHVFPNTSNALLFLATRKLKFAMITKELLLDENLYVVCFVILMLFEY